LEPFTEIIILLFDPIHNIIPLSLDLGFVGVIISWIHPGFQLRFVGYPPSPRGGSDIEGKAV
jgi:hypothetical protein